MKTLKTLLSILTISLFCSQGIAQPFELDPKIKPIELLLKADTKMDGAKSIKVKGSIHKDTIRYYVKGHDVFEFVDVFVFANKGNPEFTVKLVKDNWNDVAEKQNSKKRNHGLINFKLRTWGDFGFMIYSKAKEPIEFTVRVHATPPVRKYMDSPFVEATPENTSNTGFSPKNDTSDSSFQKGEIKSSNILIYIFVGVLLLIVGLLAGKLLGRKKTMFILLFFSLSAFQGMYAQIEDVDENNETSENVNEEIDDREEEQNQRVDDMLGGVNDAIDVYSSTSDLYDSYTGLGKCMNVGTPPGQPRVPSFCADDNGDCGSCFKSAREKFNFTRYQFEKLSAIYNCTKDFSDKAIAFGDNVAGLHTLPGLAWQEQKRNIEASVKELQQAVDKKYGELLKDLNESLMQLNACEAEHGIADWYDRFGYMYYEFIKINYKRKD